MLSFIKMYRDSDKEEGVVLEIRWQKADGLNLNWYRVTVEVDHGCRRDMSEGYRGYLP